eukprot:3086749-Lingulodinium_polyedra.AAC.1
MTLERLRAAAGVLHAGKSGAALQHADGLVQREVRGVEQAPAAGVEEPRGDLVEDGVRLQR